MVYGILFCFRSFLNNFFFTAPYVLLVVAMLFLDYENILVRYVLDVDALNDL